MVMRRFMPANPMRLYVTMRQSYSDTKLLQLIHMTSKERHEIRYKRRQEQRAKQKQAALKDYDDFETVFSYEHLYQSYKKCRKNVGWKASVQKYITQAPMIVNNTYEQLHSGTWKSKGFFEFDIKERGKERHIKSVTMEERVVQRCLCDYALSPALSRSFIHDNGASLPRKGYHFTMRRLKQHLAEHFRKHGTTGYILLFDFKKFFDNVSHEICKAVLRDTFTDQRIISITEHFIDMFGAKGLGLGSQISQIFALASANKLDHYIKEVLRIPGYGRYMDDGYLIHESKEYLKECLKQMKAVCTQLGITLNERKTHIVKLTHGFVFLKARVYLTKQGTVLLKIPKSSITRQRRKLKKFPVFTDALVSLRSWIAYAKNFKSHHAITHMKSVLKNERSLLWN